MANSNYTQLMNSINWSQTTFAKHVNAQWEGEFKRFKFAADKVSINNMKISLEYSATISVTQEMIFHPSSLIPTIEALQEALETGTIIPSLDYTQSGVATVRDPETGNILLKVLNTSTEGEFYDYGLSTISS